MAKEQTSPLQYLSVIAPVHNEQEVIEQTIGRLFELEPVLQRQSLGMEIVLVDDGSRDRSADIMDRIAHRDSRIRVVHLTRNFGHQAAVTAGLALATGDVVGIIDADLQDPPEVLLDMLVRWREGYQVIYGVRQKRKEWIGKRLAYWAFYRLLAAMSDIEMPLDSGDFCLMDRSAVGLLNSLPERQRFVRGLRTWVGLKQVGHPYERAARAAGTPSYTFKSLMKLATDGLISFSVAPLRVVTRLGIAGIAGAFLLGIWVLVASFLDTKTPRGWASLACLILGLSSVQLVSLGILGEYISRIFLEVKGRPTYLIARVVEAKADVRHLHAPLDGVGDADAIHALRDNR